jgi:dUTP pyrophosphatase
MIVDIKSEQILNYKSTWSCWFDFKASEDINIFPKEVWLIDTGTVIRIPEGYMLLTAPRSSTYKKMGWLILVNSVGIIDNDYCWNTDTVKFQYLNTSNKIVSIKKWGRIWQWIFVKIEKPKFNYVEVMWDKDRGWFWTTWIN